MWIELHDSSRDHPKVVKLARRLGIPKVHAFGHLCSLWVWTLRMAPDGDLSSFDVDDIEIGAEWEGEQGALVGAMVETGLIDLDSSSGGLGIHDWVEFASHLKAAKRKRDERERKRLKRLEDDKVSRDVTGQGRNSGPVTLTDRPTDRQNRQNRQTTAAQAPGKRHIDTVWSHWISRRPTTRRKTLSAKSPEHRLIKKRLADYTSAELCLAIDGLLLDEWAMEHKPELAWALRQDDKNNNVDRFIELATNGKPTKLHPMFESLARTAQKEGLLPNGNDDPNGIHDVHDATTALLPGHGEDG